MADGRRTVMADVARRAGVSAMTVSRVLNGFPGVAQETRARVEAVIAQLGYRANTAARVLAGGRSRTLGVVAVETAQFGPSHLLFGIEAAARAAGHVVDFVTLGPGGAEDMHFTLDRLRTAAVEGVIVLAPLRRVVSALGSIQDDLPLVVAGADQSTGHATVSIDQRAGARLAVEHLLDLGHPTVHHVRGARGWLDAHGRVRGWRETLQSRGLHPPADLPGDWSAAGGFAAGVELAKHRNVTAVFGANDQIALGLIRAFAEAGRRVPDDVSVVGFDDTPESAFFTPPLTTLRQDFGEAGRRCVELLLAMIEGRPHDRHVVLTTELVTRSSTAPPPH